MVGQNLFDKWPERYDQWFTTPIGKLVKEIEGKLITDLLEPRRGDTILDAGCGTGVFTVDFLTAGARVIGIDISIPMLCFALKKASGHSLSLVRGDIQHMPFKDNYFDKVASITALEFVADAKGVVDELFRVVRPGGRVVVATLNSLSPWAIRRRLKIARGKRHLLESAIFRSSDELLACSSYKGIVRTAIHFEKADAPDQAVIIEEVGRVQRLNTGAFLAVRWEKPQ